MSDNSKKNPRHYLVQLALSGLLVLVLVVSLLYVLNDTNGSSKTSGELAEQSSTPPSPSLPPGGESGNGTELQSFPRYDRLMQATQQASDEPDNQNTDWRNNFPWKPTTDEDAPYVPSHHTNASSLSLSEKRLVNEQIQNHAQLKRFFSDDNRFSPQFEQLYEVLSEYGRTNNPVLISMVFRDLWIYSKHVEKGEEEFNDIFTMSMESFLSSPEWNNNFVSSTQGQIESEAIVKRLISEIGDMHLLPFPWPPTEEEQELKMSYEQILKSGDPDQVGDFLQPYVGWTKERRERLK